MGYVMEITGTHIWYYFICKREVWLIAHCIAADQEDENIDIGRFISESTYKREKKELLFGNVKVDRIKRVDGKLVVGEIKKTSKFRKSARFQLLFYLDTLRQMGIEAEGELLFPKEKKKESVKLKDEDIEFLKKVKNEIRTIVKNVVPPPPEKINYCRSCAYREYCWAEG